MTKKQSDQFLEAFRTRQLIRFERPFEDGWVEGYVLDVGPQFFMMANLEGDMRFDGFVCCRLADIRRLRVPCPYGAFAEAALKKRGERKPKKPRVTLDSLPQLLESANRAFPLVTIHREKASDGCEIGRIIGIEKGRVSLLEINPDASWEKGPAAYPLREITRVDFGGGYEEALHLVGGGAPRGTVGA